MRRLAFPLAVLLLLPGPQTAAQIPSLEPGTRVRVTGCTAGSGHREGSFDGLRGDTLFLSQEAAVTACPLSAVERIEIFGGRSSRWKRGAVIGAIAGGVPMATWGARWGWNKGDHQARGAMALIAGGLGFSIGAAGGGLIGGAIGLFFKTEKWQAVPIHPPLLFVHPSPSGRSDFGVALRVRNW